MLDSPNLLQAVSHALTALLLVLAVTIWWRWRGLSTAIEGMSWRDGAALAGLFVLAAALRLLLPHHTIIHTNFHGLYFLEIAVGPSVPAEELGQRAPYGLGNHVFFRLLWLYLPREIPLYLTINALLSAAVPAQLYLLARLLDGSRGWGLTAGLLLAVLPAHILVSPTENDLVLCSFMALAALTHWIAWLRTGRRALLYGALAWLVLLVHTRVLVLVFPAAFVVVAMLLEGQRRARFKSTALLIGSALAALLMAPQYLLLDEVLSADHAAAVSVANLMRLPGYMFHPGTNLLLAPAVTMPLLPLLCVAGLALLLHQRRKTGLLLLLPIVTLGPLYLYFSDHLLDSLRYQYFVWPFYLLPAGSAVAAVFATLASRRASLLLRAVVLVVLCGATLLPYLSMLGHKHAITEEFEFVTTALPQLPPGSLLVENRPLEVAGHPPIAPLTIPAFMVHDAGIDVAAATWFDSATDGPYVVYVGLQSHARYLDEAPRPGPRHPDPGPYHLVPIVTTIIRPGDDSPGPDLHFPQTEVEIGFYRLHMP